MTRRLPWSVVALTLTLGVASSAAALEVPRLERRVTDLADLLAPAAENQLTGALELYQKETGHQFALLTIPSLEGSVLEQYSIEVVEAWGLGSEKFDNGLLVLVSRDDRQVRIEVGEGLEGVITDALSARIIREVIVPAFRARDFSGGLDSAFDLLMKAGRGEAVDFEDAWGQGSGGQGSGVSAGTDFGFVVLIFFLFLVILLASMFGGGGGGGGHRYRPFGHRSFGGGFSSGGFSSGGGFSGGGGSFGGGGASGSW